MKLNPLSKPSPKQPMKGPEDNMPVVLYELHFSTSNLDVQFSANPGFLSAVFLRPTALRQPPVS